MTSPNWLPARPLAWSRAMTARILSGRSGWGAEDCSACMVMRSSKANPVRLGGDRAVCSPILGAVLKSASSFTASWPQSCKASRSRHVQLLNVLTSPRHHHHQLSLYKCCSMKLV